MVTSVLFVVGSLMGSFMGLFGVAPSSLSYTLKAYDFGNGGVSSTSTSYNLNGTVGSQTGASVANGVTILRPGEKPTQNASVPAAPTLSNVGNTYNRLHLVINNGTSPTDTKFAIAISSDGFTTTNYVHSDNSVGSVLNFADYQTYAQWGGAAGFNILGLLPSTSYTVKVSAYQGRYTGSAFGPISSSVATAATTVSFSVATTSNGTPPFSVNFAGLSAGSVFSATSDGLINLSSNADFGGGVYIKDLNNGLSSLAKSYTISSATADLGVAASGYGAQASNVTQTSGGPLTSTSPYNGSVNSVGQLSSNLQQILGVNGPVTGGSAQIKFMAKASNSTPPATDYTDTETIIAALTF